MKTDIKKIAEQAEEKKSRAQNSQITIRVDKKLKEMFSLLCELHGSTAGRTIKVFMKDYLHEYGWDEKTAKWHDK